MIAFPRNKLSDFDEAMKNEWLITNGIGGFASSTALDINNRKYHALFIAALRPPGERTVILSKLDEDVEVGKAPVYRLGANRFQHEIYPKGYNFLQEFSLSPFPTHTYVAGDIELKKVVFLPYERNTAVAFYSVLNKGQVDATVSVYPLISYRHYHYVLNNPVNVNQNQTQNTVELSFDNPHTTVAMRGVDGVFAKNPVWVDGLLYAEEQNRGETSVDEGYQPGCFKFEVKSESITKFAITTAVADNPQNALKALDELGSSPAAVENLLGQELEKRESLLRTFYGAHREIKENSGLSWLLQAANDFIVKGKDNSRQIIAGYQWFGSWGRDSFVSLPGLMLATGRFEDAKGVILDYANYCKHGLVPNLIDDLTGEPLFNTVDGTLWYINSILQYLKYTNDFEFVKKHAWPTLIDIYEGHKQGTINDIRVDTDGLLAHGPQLTWMDAVVGDVPVTPRGGKAVEVQALWYNALMTLQLLAKAFNEQNIAAELTEMAQHTKDSFNRQFWNQDKKCLYDVIDREGKPDASVRPNQIIPCALDFKMIDENGSSMIVDFVVSELLTPVGLRTLSEKDPRYQGKYAGDRTSRDKAYHNGTVWPWLTGPLITAYLAAKGVNDSTLQHANSFISPLLNGELLRGGLGTLNEIYDGDAPYAPRGCIAQAWSVAEPLRALVEDFYRIRPKYEVPIIQGLENVWVSAN